MKSLLAALALTTALTAPGLASARQVTFSATLSRYAGYGNYLALYVTNAQGAYVGSLWVSGSRSRYYRHLSGWYRATRGDLAQIQGLTGASVGAGRTLSVTFDLADTLFDAGYTLHIDAAAENMGESPDDVVVPLTAAGADQPVQGRMFISDFHYSM